MKGADELEEYKGNSHASKRRAETPAATVPEKKKVEKIIDGTVTTKKKSGVSKFAEVFISEDIKSVKHYIVLDVLLPAAKKAISDVVTNGIDMLLYGEHGRTQKRNPAQKVSYRSFYDSPNDRRDYSSSRSRTNYSYDDILFNNRGQAEAVLARMEESIAEYGTVSVAEMFEYCGLTGNYTDCKYGWTDIRSASIKRVRDGYIIDMPRAIAF